MQRHLAAAVTRYKPAVLTDVTPAEFAQRIEACGLCRLREANRCPAAGQLVTIHARRASSRCEHWPGQEPPPVPALPRPATASTPLACDVVIPYCSVDVRWLPVSVDASLNQLGVETVVHIINDGVPESDDLGRVFDGHPHVRRYRNLDGPVGPYVTTNRVFASLESEWLAIQDCDDVPLPDRLVYSLGRLQAAGAELFGGAMRQFLDRASAEVPRMQQRLRRYPVIRSGETSQATPHGTCINSTMVISTAAFARVNGFAAWRFGADSEFVERSRAAGVPTIVDERIVSRRRLHGTSLSHGGEFAVGQAARDACHRECVRRVGLQGPGYDPRPLGDLAATDRRAFVAIAAGRASLLKRLLSRVRRSTWPTSR